MNSYVYIHPDVEKAATNSGNLDRINKLAARIASAPSTCPLNHRPRPYYHHRFDRNYRLLVERHTREESEVLVFRHLWKHDQYDTFSKQQSADRERHFDDNCTDKQIIDHHIKRQKPTQPVANTLSATDHSFLNSRLPRYEVLESKIVIETNEWCNTIEEWCKNRGSLLVKTMSTNLHNMIESIDKKIESKSLPSSSHVQIESGHDMQIIYRYFEKWDILMLIDVMLKETAKTAKARSTKKELSERYGVTFENEAILKQRCRRLYPRLLIYGYNEWWEVQATKKANMVLSPEESMILETVRSCDSNVPPYPLFVNGRAGSGKSTILQFLFAGVLKVYFQNQGLGDLGIPPIYITYNKQLLEQAKETVTEILESNPFELANRPLENATPNTQTDRCFNTVRELLRSLLPDSKQQNYKPSHYMDFKKFRPRWDDQRIQLRDPRAKELSAGIVWHGIRAYIKGLGIESFQEYSQLSDDRKSISDDTFALIYDNGWRWYNRICKEEHLWDDQDIALELQQCEDDHLSRFPAIFCDESQDFTSVELKLIQRLSRYSSCDFSSNSHLLRNIPFAFSGDPFQTLNPTGFKWGNIMTMYYEELVQHQSLKSTERIKLNYHELSRNYRSVSGIIRLSNLVQFIRCLLTNETETKPQNIRDATPGPVPQGFVLDEPDHLVESRIGASRELFIIVPCEDGEEKDYWSGDEFLRSLVDKDVDNKHRIISPLQAKGLEWERVLVYRFGEFALRKCQALCEFLQNPTIENVGHISENERFLTEYFLNKLYVAVTRPRTRLLLADSREAMHKFWRFASDPSFKGTLLDISTSMGDWNTNDLGGFEVGKDGSWDENRDSPTRIADELERQGLTDGDTDLLERARHYFGIDDDQLGQDRCSAEIAELSGDFPEAAEIYAKLNFWQSVLRCRWVLGEWSKIASAAETGVYVEQSSEAATLLRAARVLDDDKFQRNELEAIIDLFSGEQRHIFIGEQSYTTGLEKFLSNVFERLAIADFEAESSWCGIPEVLEDALRELDVSGEDLDLRLAQVYHRSGDSKSAIRIWSKYFKREPISGQDPSWAVQAAVASMGVYDRLKIYAQSGDIEGVLAAWSQIISSGNPVDMDAALSVVNLAIRNGRPSAPFKALEKLHDTNRCVRIVGALGQGLDADVKAEVRVHCISSLVSSLVAARDWQKISVLCDQRTLRDPVVALRRTWGWKRPQVLRIVTDLIARARVSETWVEQDRGEIRSLLLTRHLWRQRRSRNAKSGLPDLDAVLRSLVRVPILAALVEAVCSVQESYSFYRELESVLSSRKRVSRDEVQFARERLLACAARLPKKPPKWHDWCRDWDIDSDELAESVVLPPLSEEYIADLYLGSRVEPAPVVDPKVIAPREDSGANMPVAPPDPGPGVVTATSASMTIVLRCGDRILDGECVQIKQRIQLRDRSTGDQVVCGPDSVQSVDDLTIKPEGVAPHSSWLIDEWGIGCRIERRADGTMIQFFSAAGVIAPGCVFPIPSDGVKS